MGESNSNFRERLALALTKKGMSQVDLANATGVPYPTVAAWGNGRTTSIRGSSRAAKVADVLGVSLTWLNDGEGEMTSKAEAMPAVSSIPIYNVEFGCGDAEQPTYEEIADMPPCVVPTSWLVDAGAAPNNCKAVMATGNSMEPRINKGDIVILDTTPKNDLVDGKMYAFAYGHSLRIKMLARTMNGGLRITSYNPAYPAEMIEKEDCINYFHYVGAVVLVISRA